MPGHGRLAIAPEVVYQEVEGELILLDIRGGQYYALGSVGSRCWQLLAQHGDDEEVIKAIVGEFEVDEATARSDVGALVRRLLERGLLVEVTPPGR